MKGMHTDFLRNEFSHAGRTQYFENDFQLTDNLDEQADFSRLQYLLPRQPYVTRFAINIICVRGELSFSLNQKTDVLRANEFINIGNNDRGEVLQASSDFQFMAIAFSNMDYVEDLYSKDAWDHRIFYLMNRKIRLTTFDTQQCVNILKMIRIKIADPEFLCKKELITKGLSFIGVLAHHAILQNTQQHLHTFSKRNLLIYEQFKELLKKNFRQHHSVDFYAEKLCLSPKYMSQIVHQVSGYYASEWIKECLLDESKRLLGSGTYSVCQVSEMLGFPSDSYFNRYFKRETGITPKRFQK